MITIKAKWEGLKEWEHSELVWKEKVINQSLEEVVKVAYKIERDAKLLTPVDTGKLRHSLSTDLGWRNTGVEAEIGTDVEYSDIVEFGAVNQRAQPYLIPSFNRNVNGLERTINNILRG